LGKKRKNSAATGKVVRVDPSCPDSGLIRDAVGVIREKGVLVFPTSGLYGMGADAFSPAAVRRIYSAKKRQWHQPLLVLISDRFELTRVVRSIPAYAIPLFSLWPGDITLIFDAADGVPDELTGGTHKIGVRRPAHPVARALVEAFGGPITGTSANLSGSPAAYEIHQIPLEIRKKVEIMLDAGPLGGGSGSTILDVSSWPVRLIREGRVSFETVQRFLKKG
jgi:L-threonylcarbamoyladenylate synthase